MTIMRTIRSFRQRPVKEKVSFVFVVILFLTLMWVLKNSFLRKLQLFCPSKRSLIYNDTLSVMGVRLISSVPEKPDHSDHTSKGVGETKHGIDPFESECLEVGALDGSGLYMICIHDPFRDALVSAHLKSEGHWERENIQALYEAHKRFPSIALVDLGCNIGVFTLPAAKMGMEVIAVDAMHENLKLLQRSVQVNDLECQVTLIHNAVHRRRRKVRLVVDPSNIGGAVVKEINDMQKLNFTNSHLVDAICLDDLTPIAKGKTVFLKLDLEGTEMYVFRCAQQFFNEVTVKVMLIQWSYYRNNNRASSYIKNFLKSQNMIPTQGLNERKVLDFFDSQSWPEHVFWMKQD